MAYVLVVEDEPVVRRATVRIVTSLGVTVKFANNGEEALKIIRDLGIMPDLVITDWLMPIMGGQDLLLELKKNGKECPPIIVVSGGDGGNGTLKNAIGLGAKMVFMKPFDITSFLDEIGKILDL